MSWPSSFIPSGFPKAIRCLEPHREAFRAYRLSGKGCDVYFATYEAGTRIEVHSPAAESHGLITRGELILIVGGWETRFPAGSWYHIRAGQAHAARFEVETEEIKLAFG
jgi:quercetin dioxygenase-like cupin family protein